MGIGDFISGIFGSKNKERAKAYEVDGNAYEYGGAPGGADAAAGRYAARADDWQNKSAEYGAQQQNLYNRGESAMNQQNDARGMQMDAASMARARATGQAPSIAQMQGDRAMGQAVAAQASQAASARGPAALALAQQGAANNMANAQSQIAGQSQIAAAQERLAAEQAYAQQSGAIRGGDQGAAQVSYGAGAQSGSLGIQAGNLGLGYTGAEQGVRQAQMTGAQNREAQKSANEQGAQTINAGVGGQNAAMNQQNALGAVNMVGSIVSKVASSDARGKVPASIASYVPSTWGNAGPDEDAQRFAVGEAEQGAALYNRAEQLEKQLRAPAEADVKYAQDQRRVSAMLGQGNNLTEDDLRRERFAKAKLRSSPTEETKAKAGEKEAAKDEKAKVADGKAVPETARSKVASVLGDVTEGAGKLAQAVDVRYHGPSGGYIPPQLLAVSDATKKIPLVDLTKASGREFASNPTTYAMEQDGEGKVGIDVMNTFKAQNDKIMTETRNPGGQAAATGPGSMMSDVVSKQPFALSDTVGKFALSDVVGKLGTSDSRAKTSLGEKLAGPQNERGEYTGARDGSDHASMPTLGNYRDFGMNPHVTHEGRGVLVQDPIAAQSARSTVDGGAGEGSEQEGRARSAKAKAGSGTGRKMTPDEMSAWADRELAKVKREGDARLATGPAVDAVSSRWGGEEAARAKAAAEDIQRGKPPSDPMADAARAMQASTYAYKPEMTPQEQKPGEPNVGPMAQTMASSPVTATAIKKDPRTGMLMIDQSKMLKVLGGVAAHQQNQIDALARRQGKRRG